MTSCVAFTRAETTRVGPPRGGKAGGVTRAPTGKVDAPTRRAHPRRRRVGVARNDEPSLPIHGVGGSKSGVGNYAAPISSPQSTAERRCTNPRRSAIRISLGNSTGRVCRGVGRWEKVRPGWWRGSGKLLVASGVGQRHTVFSLANSSSFVTIASVPRTRWFAMSRASCRLWWSMRLP